MPRDGAIIFSDLIGKLDVLRVHAPGATALQRLIDEHGENARLTDWLDEIAAGCPKKLKHNWNDQCAAWCPDLPRVFRPL